MRDPGGRFLDFARDSPRLDRGSFAALRMTIAGFVRRLKPFVLPGAGGGAGPVAEAKRNIIRHGHFWYTAEA